MPRSGYEGKQIGEEVGWSPNPKVSIPSPRPPNTPNPIPPIRAPIIMAIKTKANCNNMLCNSFDLVCIGDKNTYFCSAMNNKNTKNE